MTRTSDSTRSAKSESGPRVLAASSAPANRWCQRASTATAVLAWTWFVSTIGIAAILRLAGDVWWPATLLAFGPRWVVLLPLPALVPPALLFRRSALVPIGAGGVVIVAFVMGFLIPWTSSTGESHEDSFRLRVVTLNVGEGIDVPTLVRFLHEVDPDVVAFQECSANASSPYDLPTDWHFDHEGELFIASRYPIISRLVVPAAGNSWRPPALRCTIDTPRGHVDVCCLHLYTLRKGLEAVMQEWSHGVPELKRVIAIRNDESAIAAKFAGRTGRPTIVMGDFNMTRESAIFGKDWGEWQDAFAERGFGFGNTFHTRKIGLRIDHVLVDRTHWRVLSCRLGPGVHGQHRPLMADLSVSID